MYTTHLHLVAVFKVRLISPCTDLNSSYWGGFWHWSIIDINVYNIMIWYLHVLQNDCHSHFSYYHHRYLQTLLHVMRTLKINSLSNFPISGTVLYSIVKYSSQVINYIPRIYLFCNWKFIPFDALTHFAHLLLPPSGNYQFILCSESMSFFIFI